MLGVGAVVLTILIARLGPGHILDLILSVRWAFAAAVVLYAVHLVLRAYGIWRALPDGAVSLGEVIRIRFAAEAIEMLTFTGPFLAEPAKGLLFVDRGVSVAEAFGAIAFEYLTYTAVAAALAVGALTLLLAQHALPAGVTSGVIGLSVALGLFDAGFVFAAITGHGLLVPLLRASRIVIGQRRADTAAAHVAPTEQVLLQYLHHRPMRLLEVAGAELIGHATFVVEIWVVFRAMQLPVSWTAAWIVEGGVKFINAAFFFVPGQVGAAEGITAIVVGAVGLPGAAGVTLALVRRIRSLLVAATGLIVLPARREPARPVK
jgi:lysylphosphatidylglycerol synthase-like protein